MRTKLTAVLALAVAAGGGSVRADEVAVRKEAPWALRGEAFMLSGSGSSTATAGSFGLTVQRRFFDRFAWEETITWGAGNRKVDGSDIGWTFAGTGRAAVWQSADRTHAVMLALGTALVIGGGYGTLNFLYGEGGYEFRGSSGLRVIVAGGPDMLLSHPTASTCANEPWVCANFRRGGIAPLGHLRAGLGWAF